ncbi:hypothetical protein FOL46_005497 [Perkinsus olseni]|nr:hypothetical protein FOL46_005497 [Perkinsus olseni]
MHVVNAATNAHIGYWYVRVFARSKKYKTGLASTVSLCDGHVFTELNFVRPQVNVVRKLYYEEVLSFGHQMGTAMHMLFGQSKTAHLPLDAKALAGSLAELAALDSDVIRYMARDGGRVPSEHEIRSVRRDVYFYVWALREIAVICVLHSGEFDPDTATVEDLRNKAKEVARAFSPVELAPSYHPLTAEAGMWTVSEGATEKLGYLFAHMRASSLLSRLRASAKGRTNSVYNTPPVTEGLVGELLRSELLEKKFSPHSLECLMAAIDGAQHQQQMTENQPLMASRPYGEGMPAPMVVGNQAGAALQQLEVAFFFAALGTVVAGVSSTLTTAFTEFAPFDLTDDIYLLAFGLIMLVVDAPVKPRGLLFYQAFVSRYVKFLTRLTGKGFWYVFLGIHVFIALWTNDAWPFAGLILGPGIFLVGCAGAYIGMAKTRALDAVARKLVVQSPEQLSLLYKNNALSHMSEGLTQEEFNNIARNNAGIVFAAEELGLIFNAICDGRRFITLRDLAVWLQGPRTLV